MNMWIKSALIMAAAAAGTAEGVHQTRNHDYTQIGKPNGQACNGFTIKCAGFLTKSLSDPTYNKEALVESLQNIQWEQPAYPSRRPRADNPEDTLNGPVFTIQSIPKAHSVALAKMPKGGYILARIIADPNGPEDSRYGIGQQSTAEAGVKEPIFFIVVTAFDTTDSTPKEGGRKAAKWEVWGISGSPRSRKLVRVGTKSGNLRYCGPAHPTSYDDRTAKFLKCTTIESIYALRTDKALSAQLLGIGDKEMSAIGSEDPRISLDRYIAAVRSIANNSAKAQSFSVGQLRRIQQLNFEINNPKNPAWMACGLGCCTADDI